MHSAGLGAPSCTRQEASLRASQKAHPQPKSTTCSKHGALVAPPSRSPCSKRRRPSIRQISPINHQTQPLRQNQTKRYQLSTDSKHGALGARASRSPHSKRRRPSIFNSSIISSSSSLHLQFARFETEHHKASFKSFILSIGVDTFASYEHEQTLGLVLWE